MLSGSIDYLIMYLCTQDIKEKHMGGSKKNPTTIFYLDEVVVESLDDLMNLKRKLYLNGLFGPE